MKKNGFTIMELAVSLSIFGILATIAAGIITIGVDSYNLFVTRTTMAREAQNTLRIMQEKIPLARPDKINKAAKNRFRFITEKGEDVDFEYVKNKSYLRYRIIGQQGWRIIMNDIAKNGFQFNYQEADGKNKAKKQDIRRVIINFNQDVDGQSASYTYRFFIRNN
jgi:prepilin-type N-terminal cleavage/methylation domain-containing protein